MQMSFATRSSVPGFIRRDGANLGMAVISGVGDLVLSSAIEM